MATRRTFVILLAASIAVGLASAASAQSLGTLDDPILFFVSQYYEDIAEEITDRLLDATGLYVEPVSLPDDELAQWLAMEDGKAFSVIREALDYVWQDGLSARICNTRYGAAAYYVAIYARRDSGIEDIADLAGRTWAYPYWWSTGAYSLPEGFFSTRGVLWSDSLETGGHTAVAVAVLEGNADFGTAYFMPPVPSASCSSEAWMWGDDPERWLWDRELDKLYPAEGRGICADVRRALFDAYDEESVLNEIGVLALLGPIPNECIAFAPGFPEGIADRLVDAIVAQFDDDETRAFWSDPSFVEWNDITEVDDSFYDCLREILGIPIPAGRQTSVCSYVAGQGLPGVNALDTAQILACTCSENEKSVGMFFEAVPGEARISGGSVGKISFNIDVKNQTGVEVDNIEVVVQGIFDSKDVSWWYNGPFTKQEVIPDCARNETVLRWWGTTIRPGRVVHVGATVRNVGRILIQRIEWTWGWDIVDLLPACSPSIVAGEDEDHFVWRILNAGAEPVTVSDVAFAGVGSEIPLSALNAEELEPALRERGAELEPCEECGGRVAEGEAAPIPVRVLGRRFSLDDQDVSVVITVNPSDPDEGESYTLHVSTIPTMPGLTVDVEIAGTDGWTCATTSITNALGVASIPSIGDDCDDGGDDGRIPGAEAQTVEHIRIKIPDLDWEGEVFFVF